MGIITKRNGKILMILGVLLIIIGFLGIIILYETLGESSIYMALGGVFAFCFVIIGPMLTVVGIPVFFVSSRRVPSKLMDILKTSVDMRTKISFLAQQLAINEKDVISTVFKLRSSGEPILIDYSTSEVIYNPTLSPTTEPPSRPEMEVKPQEKSAPTPAFPPAPPVPPPEVKRKTSRVKLIFGFICALPMIWAGGIFFYGVVSYISGLSPDPLALLICGLPLIFGLPFAFWKRTRPWAEVAIGLWVFGVFFAFCAWLKAIL